MFLFYKSKSEACYKYKLTRTPSLQVFHVTRSELPLRVTSESPTLLFLLQGSVRVQMGIGEPQRVAEGHLFFVPTLTDVCAYTESDCTVLACAFRELSGLNDFRRLEELAGRMEAECLSGDSFYCLPIHDTFHSFCRLLQECLESGMQEEYYLELKKEEIGMMLRNYYTPEQFACLFYPIIGLDRNFEQLVLDHYREVDTVEQFAALAHMAVSTFQRKFKQVFRMPVKQWLVERKAESVMKALRTTDKTMEEIAFDLGFSSPAHFSTFCKRVFGQSPSRLKGQMAGRWPTGRE